MIALEDVRGIYLPKRPRMVPLDDAAFTEACLKNRRAVAWHVGDEADWQASGRAGQAERSFRADCASSRSRSTSAPAIASVLRRDTFARPAAPQAQVKARRARAGARATGARAAAAAAGDDDRRALRARRARRRRRQRPDARLRAEARGARVAQARARRARLWDRRSSAREARSLREHALLPRTGSARASSSSSTKRGGFAAVDDAFAHPPKSTAGGIIHATPLPRAASSRRPTCRRGCRCRRRSPPSGTLVFGERGNAGEQMLGGVRAARRGRWGKRR